jgi:ABC-2 type transport system permease protein
MTTPALVSSTIRGTTVFSRDGMRDLRRRQKPWVLVLAGFGGLVGVGTFAVFLTSVYAGMAAMGAAAGHPELALFYGLLLSWVFLFVTGIPIALSVMAYSKDLQLLRVLPVRPVQIVAAKGFLLYLYALPMSTLMLLPSVVISAGPLGAGAGFWLAAAVHLLVSPLLPVALSVFVVLALMRLVDLSRFRTAFEVAGMALGLGLVIGLQTFLQRSMMSTLSGGEFGPVTQFPDLFAVLARALPPIAWAARSFVAGVGPAPMAASLGLTVVCAAAAFTVAPFGFLRDSAERVGGRSRRHRAGAGAAAATAATLGRGGSVVRSLLAREVSILSSNSTFIFQAVGEVLILPLVLGIYAFLLPREISGQALGFITTVPWSGPALLGVLVLMTNLTTVSSTSVSREGRLFGLSLSIPVAGRTQIQSKLAMHMVLYGAAFLIDCGIAIVLFRVTPVSLVYYLPAGLAFQVVGFCFGMFLDLKRPMLKWTHPQQAMKNNTNALGAMGGTAAVVMVVGGPSAFAIAKGASPFLVGCGIALVAIAMAAVLLPRLLAFADRQYAGGLELTSS